MQIAPASFLDTLDANNLYEIAFIGAVMTQRTRDCTVNNLSTYMEANTFGVYRFEQSTAFVGYLEVANGLLKKAMQKYFIQLLLAPSDLIHSSLCFSTIV